MKKTNKVIDLIDPIDELDPVDFQTRQDQIFLKHYMMAQTRKKSYSKIRIKSEHNPIEKNDK